MDILILSWRGPGHPNAGGAEVVTLAYAKSWVRAGHKVVLFTSSFPAADQAEIIIDGVRIIRRGGQSFGVKVQALLWYLFQNKVKFDLVVDEFHGIPFFTPLYIKTAKLAFIHEVAKEVWKLNPWPKPWNVIPSIIGTALEPLIFRLIYRNIPFMTVSNSTKNDLLSWGIAPRRITVINNGIEDPINLSGVRRERKITITYLGALSKDKGVEDAILTFNLLKQKHPHWQFWMVGAISKPYDTFLYQMIKDLGLTQNIKYWGYVDERKKYELMRRSWLLINPSIREGWGLVVIEAAAMGTPTVGYNVQGLKDSIRNHKTGILVSTNPKSLANAVNLLMNNHTSYVKLSLGAKKWAKQFKWEKSFSQSLALIEQKLKI